MIKESKRSLNATARYSHLTKSNFRNKQTKKTRHGSGKKMKWDA